MIKYTLGWMMLFEAAFFLIPIITAVLYQEWMTLVAFLISAALCLAIGYLCKYKKPEK
jgi:trk system potassium uptake protein TrkH